jgi:hypothetical protein
MDLWKVRPFASTMEAEATLQLLEYMPLIFFV